MPAEEQITVAELAKAWRVSKNFIYDLISAGKLAATNLGEGRAKTRVSKSVVDEYIAARTRLIGSAASHSTSERAA